MKTEILTCSYRIGRTPYIHHVKSAGAARFSSYNHMLVATVIRSLEEDYWHLRKHAQLWDVNCQRQIEIIDTDASRLAQLMTPRNLSELTVGQCFSAPMLDNYGGLLNDPIILLGVRACCVSGTPV